MSLLLTPYVEFFMLSLTSLLNTDRFWVNLHTHRFLHQALPRRRGNEAGLPDEATYLSRFLVRRFLSMPSIKFSKHKCMACCFSGGWLLTMLFLRSAKYCGEPKYVQTGALGAGAKRGHRFYLLVEQDEAQEGPGHGPLVPTVFKDDDVQHGGQHLSEDGTVTRGRLHL